MERENIEKNKLLNELTRIGHGDLSVYNEVGLRAVQHEPFLYAHFVAWNQRNNRVRDSKVAFPVIGLRSSEPVFQENAAANLALQAPRELLRACYYHKSLPTVHGGGSWLKKAVVGYIRAREQNNYWWDRTALQHRRALKGLYALNHLRPSPRADAVLFKDEKPKGSVFEALPLLRNMPPTEAAGTILNLRVPFNIAIGAVPSAKDSPDISLALIERMSGQELINNAKAITKMSSFSIPAVKAAFDSALERAKKDKRVSSMKAGVAAKAIGGTTAKKLEKVQTTQMDSQAGKIEGNWLILGDRSGSMYESIKISKQLSALLAERVSGEVFLTMFNHMPFNFKITGMSLHQIEGLLKGMHPSGGTSIGCGLVPYVANKINLDGIVIISDGGQRHREEFWDILKLYEATVGFVPALYLLHVPGDPNILLQTKPSNRELEVFEFERDFDYYSLPNVIKLIKPNTFQLLNEVLETPLLTLSEALRRKEN